MTIPQLLASLQRLLDEYDVSRDPAQLLATHVVADGQRLADLARIDIEEHAAALATVGRLHWYRFLLLPEPDDLAELDTALGLFELITHSRPDLVPPAVSRYLTTEPAGDEANPRSWGTLGRDFLAEYRASDELASLDAAVAAFRQACSTDGGRRVGFRTELAFALMLRYESSGNPDDLDEATARLQSEAYQADQARPNPNTLVRLFIALAHRYELVSDANVLTEAIKMGRAAKAVLGEDYAGRTYLLYMLGFLLGQRYELTSSGAHLDEAVELTWEAVRSSTAEDEDLPRALASLASLLHTRFSRSGSIEDLDEGVHVARRAAASVDLDQPTWSGLALSTLSAALYLRFTHSGRPTDLDEALAAGRAALHCTHPDDPHLVERLSNLGLILWERYRWSGDRSDLAEAVAVNRAAVERITPDDDEFAALATNVGIALMANHEVEHQSGDLDAAIAWFRKAIAATPAGHDDRAPRLSNLGLALRARFERTGAADDLDEAIALSRQAVAETPAYHPDRAWALSNLGLALRARFERTGNRGDLDEAIEVGKQALAATSPTGHIDGAARLSNLGLMLRARFERAGAADDLDEAIALSRQAVAETPAYHPDRAWALSNLGLAMRARFERTGDTGDLDEAIEIGRQAVLDTPADHPSRADRLLNFGGTLLLTQPDGRHEAVAVMREAAQHVNSRVPVRAVAALHWAHVSAERGEWEEALDGYALAVELVSRMTPRTLAQSDVEFHLSGFPGLASDALACALQVGAPERALELSEQGRGVLLGQALDTRTDLSGVARSYPEFAERFATVRRALNEFPSMPETAERRRELARDFDRLVVEIRMLDGFADFLRPPRVEDLLGAAEAGPVVLLNVSKFRSDALVLTCNGLQVVPLPDVTPELVRAHELRFRKAVRSLTSALDVRDRSSAEEQIGQTLAWLWHAITEPVLHQLNLLQPPTNGEAWPHVWWCPSGELAFLPLHAAGDYTTRRSVLDLVVSSYVPTVRALLHARRRGDRDDRADRVSVVAMANTPGADDLPGATLEAELLSRRFPAAVQVLSGQAATREAVLKALSGSSVLHLACHGVAEPADPSSSYLLLAGGKPLTVQSLLREKPVQAKLAYLSACETALSGAALPDEAIHLASSFQLAGYPHVIGTLWPVEDRYAARVAALFYAAVDQDGHLNSSRAAFALHQAVRQMRERYPDRPSLWAAHIHVGP